jgi:hypothetical protein
MFGENDLEQERATGIGPAGLARPNELLRNAELAMAGLGYLEWARYVAAAELHRRVVEPHDNTTVSLRAVDPYAVCAARLAAAQQMTQTGAEHHLSRALALRDRLPQVALLLKQGLVAPHHIAAIVSRTDLIDGSAHMSDIDRDIADHLRRRGSWSKNRLRDMVDATIFRRDPDMVRQDREDAKKKRGVFANNIGSGMAAIDAVASAEDIAIIMTRLEKLAASVCPRDPRRKSDRMADALFASVMARDFYCQCPNDEANPCTAQITAPTEYVSSGISAKIVLHVIADQATLDGTADNPGFLNGHGVISADHVRDIAEHPDTVTRPIGNEYKAEAASDPAEPAWHNWEFLPDRDLDDPTFDPDPIDPYLEDEADDETPPLASGPGTGLETKADIQPDDDTVDEPQDEAESMSSPNTTEPPGNSTALPAPDQDHEPAEPRPDDNDRASPPPNDPEKTTPTRRIVYARAPQDVPLGSFPEVADDVTTVPAAGSTSGGSARRPVPAISSPRQLPPHSRLLLHLAGCDKKAWDADLDHSREYNHDDPDSGGQTHPREMKALCRFHHLLKTYSDWLADQYPDPRTGRTTIVFTTPEGKNYDGPAWTGDDLFPILSRIIWDPGLTRRRPAQTEAANRTRSRTAAKHARRQQERERNRRLREIAETTNPPPF